MFPVLELRGSLWYRGTTIWNNLRPPVIAAKSLAKFKTLYFVTVCCVLFLLCNLIFVFCFVVSV